MHNSKTKTVSTFPWIFIPVHICSTFILNLALISLRNCNLSEDLGCFHLEQSKIKDSSKLQWSKTNNRRKDIVPIQLLNSGVGYNLFSHLCLIWLSHAGLKDYLIAFQCACLLQDQAHNQHVLTLMQGIPDVIRFFTPCPARQ